MFKVNHLNLPIIMRMTKDIMIKKAIKMIKETIIKDKIGMIKIIIKMIVNKEDIKEMMIKVITIIIEGTTEMMMIEGIKEMMTEEIKDMM